MNADSDPGLTAADQLRGARPGPPPADIQVQLATRSQQAPAGDRWLHEIKLDGYRMLCRIESDGVRFVSRNGNVWNDRLGELIAAVDRLPVENAILDGEVVVLAADGTTSFQALQNTIGSGRGGMLYYVFDLLYLNGVDLRKVALESRKELLQMLFQSLPRDFTFRYCEHIVGEGPEVVAQAAKLGVEGIISKRRDRPYRSGRGDSWLKTKFVFREEFVIGGWTDPNASRQGLGALVVGYYDPDGKLRYAGRVGSGFTETTLVGLRKRLQEKKQKRSPFVALPDDFPRRGVHWVEPELVAQVEYASWTAEGSLRFPTFQGLREDRQVADVVLSGPPDSPTEPTESVVPPQAVNAEALSELKLTNPDRVVYPDVGITKLGVASYYAAVADWMLPHIVGRPLTLVRAPQGLGKKQFFQKHAMPGLPKTIERQETTDSEGNATQLLLLRDLAGLMALVQFSALELHTWNARCDRLDRPDRMVFDLDPHDSVNWSVVVETACELRELLSELMLTSFVKTSGGSGLHVVVPLERRHSWDVTSQFARQVASVLAVRHPARYTLRAGRGERTGRIYLDVVRNVRGATTVSPYSTRARAGAPVSLPVAWNDLSNVTAGDHFTIQNVPRRLASLTEDPWSEMSTTRQTLTAAARQRLAQLVE